MVFKPLFLVNISCPRPLSNAGFRFCTHLRRPLLRFTLDAQDQFWLLMQVFSLDRHWCKWEANNKLEKQRGLISGIEQREGGDSHRIAAPSTYTRSTARKIESAVHRAPSCKRTMSWGRLWIIHTWTSLCALWHPSRHSETGREEWSNLGLIKYSLCNALPHHTHRSSSYNFISSSAESILTLKNRESIHFGHFHDRFYEKNQFMIHELIHISIHVSLLPWWNMAFHVLWYMIRSFKNRISTNLYRPPNESNGGKKAAMGEGRKSYE